MGTTLKALGSCFFVVCGLAYWVDGIINSGPYPRPYGGYPRYFDEAGKHVKGYNNIPQPLLSLIKSPHYLKRNADRYEKCTAEHGAESDRRCQLYKKMWLECKAVQNA